MKGTTRLSAIVALAVFAPEQSQCFIIPRNSQLKPKANVQFPLLSRSDPNGDEQLKSFDDLLKRRTKDEWIGGQEMKQIIAAEEQQTALQERRRAQQQLIRDQRESNRMKPINFKSRMSYTDANTLEIEFPAAGMTSNSVAGGAFAAVWFGAITPATLSMMSAGLAPLLFMAPFWVAGAVVAKVSH